MRRIVAAFAAACLAGGALAAPADPIASACLARPGAQPAGCACQARLARATLTSGEAALVVVALRQGREAMQARMAKLSAAAQKTFSAKMARLGALTEQQCR